jgi:capsular polysaccharide biosynthesis protein
MESREKRMTVSNPQADTRAAVPPPQEAWAAEDEIDLRQYFLVLVAWWREIVMITILAALIGAAFILIDRNISTPYYRSSATVVISRTKSEIVFDDRFRTASEASIQALQTDRATRRSTLMGLVKNSQIAHAVVGELGSQLSDDERDPAVLLNMVEAETASSEGNRSANDLILITVEADSAAKAAAIANSWAIHYVDHVNDLFGQVPGEVLASVAEQRTLAYQVYNDAQLALENFIGQSQVTSIDRAINETQQLLTLYTTVENARLDGMLAVFQYQSLDHLTALQQAYDSRLRLQRLVQDAQALQSHLEAGGDATASTSNLAVLLMKAEAFAATPLLSANLQLNLETAADAEVNASQMAENLGTLIEALNQRIVQVDQEITTQSEILVAGTDYHFLDQISPSQVGLSALTTGSLTSVDATNQVPADQQTSGVLTLSSPLLREEILRIEQELQVLQSRLESEKAQRQLLAERRDLAWTTWKTLENKSTELALTTNAANSEVRFAAPAIPPQNPIKGPSLLVSTALAAVVGFILAIFIAFFANFMGAFPFLTRPRGEAVVQNA